MTPRQADVLAFIAWHLERSGGIAPSLEQIAAGIGIKSRGSVARLVVALAEQGFIRRSRRARSIKIVDPGEVKLNAEIFRLVSDYARQEKIGIDTAANELLRQSLGAAA